METRRWTNPSQPQTLYMAHLFLYFSAGWNLIRIILFQTIPTWVLPSLSVPSVTLIVCEVFGGYLIANERKLGWWVALGSVALSLYTPVQWLLIAGVGIIFNLNWILIVVFPVVLLILLVHPMSRDYQRIWFK